MLDNPDALAVFRMSSAAWLLGGGIGKLAGTVSHVGQPLNHEVCISGHWVSARDVVFELQARYCV